MTRIVCKITWKYGNSLVVHIKIKGYLLDAFNC